MSISPPFTIHKFSKANLIKLITVDSKGTRADIAEKDHLDYFSEYFKKVVPQYILVENDYIDQDYMEDFAGYYAKCYHQYKRNCRRLHFFGNRITTAEIKSLLERRQMDKDFRSVGAKLTRKLNYLGFMVVKPLPKTVIGRTVLKTYPSRADNGDRRCFPSIYEVTPTLFGIPLTIDSLPFQEQDQAASACATSALWSTLNATSRVYRHHVPSPIEITKGATDGSSDETRFLPNEGLTIEQMAQAIRNVGLEPICKAAENYELLKGYAHAYLHKLGTPIILNVFLYDQSIQTSEGDEISDDDRLLGFHAVAIAGYGRSKNNSTIIKNDEGTIRLRTRDIGKFFVHDDQLGPFARIVLPKKSDQAQLFKIEGKTIETKAMETTWKGMDGSRESVYAVPDSVLIPVDQLIRIDFDTIHDTIESLTRLLDAFAANFELPRMKDLSWEIYLISNNQYKGELLSKQMPSRVQKRQRVLTQNMPKYLWCASAFVGNQHHFDLLFDATAVTQGPIFVCPIFFKREYKNLFEVASVEEAHFYEHHSSDPAYDVLWWFRSSQSQV